jgi:phage-related baseplate assembly protein
MVDVFDGKPFVLPTAQRPSRPLYDALMIAFSNDPALDLTARAASIRKSLSKALENEESYDVLVGRGNTMAAIRERVELAAEILHVEDQ